MQASVGDQIVVRSRRVGQPNRRGVIVEARGEAGRPPYRVRWSDGHTDLFFPSTDASIEKPAGARTTPAVAEPRVPEAAPAVKRKDKVSVSRAEAGRRLAALARAVSGPGDVTVELGGQVLTVAVPPEVELEVEVDRDRRGGELEIDLTWPAPTT